MAVVGLVLLSSLLTYVIWQQWDLRGLVVLAVFLCVGEIFHQVRWRQSMICANCGFDPILYLRSPEKAGEKIKSFLEFRSERPEYLLRPQPQFPVRRVAAKGENISLRG
jgi:hypothetical protein